jgi:hypothetical protein
MKRFTGFALLTSTLLLLACVNVKPEDYGFQRVTITGQEHFCAPRDWVVPPVVPQEAADDPLFPLYRQFLSLPDEDINPAGFTPRREVCITQAQWPQWLTVRNRWNRDWPVTPGTADAIVARRSTGP